MSRQAHSTDESAWADFAARHRVDDVIEGDVVSVVPFGAFIRVGGGVDGLAPKADWPALPPVGSRVRVRIAAIDAVNRRAAFGPA